MCTKHLSNLYSLPWEVAQPVLSRALGAYDPAHEVNAGKAFPFLIGQPDDGAVMLVRTENFEMVVIAFEGVHKLKNASQIIVDLAHAIRANTIRIHTKRKGEQRFLNQLGLNFHLVEKQEDEFILRMDLHGR